MKRSAKMLARIVKALGYDPNRLLTNAERKKCGLRVKEKHESRGNIGTVETLRPKPKAAKQNYRYGARIRVCSDSQKFADPGSYITKDGRVRLKGEDYEALRTQAFERAGGRCERVWLAPFKGRYVKTPMLHRCPNPAPWDGSIFFRGHLAHKKHGPRKSDTLDQVIWSCSSCHFSEHGLKWRKQRMEKAWEAEYFEQYYHEQQFCVCMNLKHYDSAMCNGCRQHLRDTQPALLHIIENGSGHQSLHGLRAKEAKA